MSREKEQEQDDIIARLQQEVLELDAKLRHEREKLADIELFIAGGALEPMKPAAMRLALYTPARALLKCSDWFAT